MAESKFTGGVLGLWGMKLLAVPMAFLGFLTLGILSAWYTCFFKRWLCGHTYINGYQLRFDGGAIELWVRKIVWLLLTFVTLGIYLFFGFYTISRQRWFTSRTNFAGAPTVA